MTMINLARRMNELEMNAPNMNVPIKVVFTRNDEPAPAPPLLHGQRLCVVRFVSPDRNVAAHG